MSAFFSALGKLYLETPALYELDTSAEGFSVTVGDDSEQSVLVFRRMAKNGDELVVACNFCPVLRENYRVGVAKAGTLSPILSTAESRFGGDGTALSEIPVRNTPSHGLPFSAHLTLPKSSVTFYLLKAASGNII